MTFTLVFHKYLLYELNWNYFFWVAEWHKFAKKGDSTTHPFADQMETTIF
jgi:hypothetical protein